MISLQSPRDQLSHAVVEKATRPLLSVTVRYCPLLSVTAWQVHVKPGAEVAEGDNLMTVSAMKMEVHVKAPFAAKVAKLQVAPGDKVIEGALVAVLKPTAAAVS